MKHIVRNDIGAYPDGVPPVVALVVTPGRVDVRSPIFTGVSRRW